MNGDNYSCQHRGDLGSKLERQGFTNGRLRDLMFFGSLRALGPGSHPRSHSLPVK
jgi:hypothetical protein